MRDLPLDCEAIQRDLAGCAIGHRMVHLEETASTNDDARQFAAAGAAHGFVIVAERQTAGRGRRGSCWISPPRQNLLCSIVLRPDLPLEDWPRLTHAAAVAIAQALEELDPDLQAKIKWPNDVFLGGKKVAGILVEVGQSAEGPFAVLGFGINVNTGPFPADLAGAATSVREELGREVSREALAAGALRLLENWIGKAKAQFATVLDQIRQRSLILGRRITLMNSGCRREGIAVAFDSTGALIFQESGRAPEIILTADTIRPADDSSW